MYNGIGLNTARGSGTNGYVQGNKAFVKDWKVKKADGHFEILNVEAPKIMGPNIEILDHEKKRKVEGVVYEFRLKLEERDLPEAEIEQLVNEERRKLLDRMVQEEKDAKERRPRIEEKRKREEKNDYRDQTHRQGHLIKEAQMAKNDRIKDALGIRKDYKVGDGFNFKKDQGDHVEEKLMIEEKKIDKIEYPVKSEPVERQRVVVEDVKRDQKKELDDDLDILKAAKEQLRQLQESSKKKEESSDDSSDSDHERKRTRYDSSDEE